MVTIKATLKGICPLLMHNGRLNNPFDPATVALKKATTSNKGKNKTEDGQIEIGRLEFLGGLVLDAKGRPAISADMLVGAWHEGARKLREGKNLLPALWTDDPFYPIVYDGPRDADALWADGRFTDCRRAGVQGAGVMRTRPIFRDWSCPITVSVDEQIIDPQRAIDALAEAGIRCGIGDYRPRYGRFALEGAKIGKARA